MIKKELKIDDPVIVYDSDFPHIPLHAHFAGWNAYGDMMTFSKGRTSWSYQNRRMNHWQKYKIPEFEV